MSKDRLRELMQEAYDKHRQFHAEFRKGSRYENDGRERSAIVGAREAFFDAQHRLYNSELEPLRQHFSEDPLAYLDEVIGFLEIDIPCHRCGYEKEWYLGKLKSLTLTLPQKEKLKTAALGLIKSTNHRREIRDWARLMIVLADKAFVDQVMSLRNESGNSVSAADMMLTVLRENRRDLSL